MNIAFVGGPRTGKTTLCNYLFENFELNGQRFHIAEDIIQKRQSKKNTLEYYAFWDLVNRYEETLLNSNFQNILFHETPLHYYAGIRHYNVSDFHGEHYGLMKYFMNEYIKEVLSKRYDFVVIAKNTEEFKFKTEEFKVGPPSKRFNYHKHILKVLEKYWDKNQIIKVSGRVEQRAQEVVKKTGLKFNLINNKEKEFILEE